MVYNHCFQFPRGKKTMECNVALDVDREAEKDQLSENGQEYRKTDDKRERKQQRI